MRVSVRGAVQRGRGRGLRGGAHKDGDARFAAPDEDVWGVEDLAAAIPIDRLAAHGDRIREAYATGEPYPHVVVEGLFDDDVLERLAHGFPEADQRRDWVIWDSLHEYKSTSRGTLGLSTFTQAFLMLLYSRDFVAHVEQITGIRRLVPDPLYYGAGLQETPTGGWLDLHSDYTRHPVTKLARRLNLIVYLNRDWDPAWGGNIELWDRSIERGVGYEPLFNRTLVFPTSANTPHGSPRRLTSPPGRPRRMVSVYYWSTEPAHLAIADELHWFTTPTTSAPLGRVVDVRSGAAAERQPA